MRTSASFSSLLLMCVSFSAFWLRDCLRKCECSFSILQILKRFSCVLLSQSKFLVVHVLAKVRKRNPSLTEVHAVLCAHVSSLLVDVHSG